MPQDCLGLLGHVLRTLTGLLQNNFVARTQRFAAALAPSRMKSVAVLATVLCVRVHCKNIRISTDGIIHYSAVNLRIQTYTEPRFL